MNPETKFSDILIIGLGITGLATAEYLAKNKIPFTIADSRPNPPKLEEFKNIFKDKLKDYFFEQSHLHIGGLEASLISSAKTIILSPGIPKDHPEIIKHVSPKTEIIGDIELFARNVKAPLAAITGSNGKSTVTSWVGDMAKAARLNVGVGGNLGTPALNLLENNHDLYILELSSFQLETTYSLKPVVSTILNICPDHMDRYPTLEAYFAAKERIYQNTQSIVVNRDDTLVSNNIPKNIPFSSFGLHQIKSKESFKNYHLLNNDGKIFLAKGQEAILPINDLKVIGRHNIANALASIAIAESLQIPKDAILHSLKTFRGLPHRCELVRIRQGVHWINDSKGTNVGATVAALQGLSSSIEGKWVLIAGGLGKNADFSPLTEVITQNCRSVVLIGEVKEELNALLSPTIPCQIANSFEEAVHLAAKAAQPGDGVLLSPACASFDMFKNFEHRGEVFKELVQAL